MLHFVLFLVSVSLKGITIMKLRFQHLPYVIHESRRVSYIPDKDDHAWKSHYMLEDFLIHAK